MKILLTTTLTILFTLFATTLMAQTVYVVDNTTGAPSGDHVFDNVEDAIEAASAGDIIHIRPSMSNYSGFRVNKPLSIYGIGFNPDKQAPIRSRVSGTITITAAGSGSVLSGLDLSTITFEGNPQNDPITNIRIEKNNLRGRIITSSSPQINQLLIQRNIVGVSITNADIDLGTSSNVSNVLILNNIFTDTRNSISVGNQAVISQNLFLASGSGSNFAFSSIRNVQVQNNVFLGARPRGSSSSNVQFTTFENNLLFGVSNPEFPVGENGNTGSNNLVGVNPQFVNLEPSNSGWDFDNWDASLQPGSPAIGAGINGEDLGIFGGAAPFDLTMVPLPLIQAFQVPGFIGTDDELNVTIQARSSEN